MYGNPLIYMFATLILTLLLKVPIPFALGFSCLTYLLITDIPVTLLAQQFVVMLNSFTLLAVPFFVLAGEFMSRGGIMRRLIKFAEALIGHVSGGLAHVNVVTSMILAGMSGAAVSDAAMTSMILVPEMEREGYPRPFAAAVTGATSTMGPIIPPSIPMIIIGVVNELSIGRLFIAGAIPGVIMGLTMLILVAYQARKRKFPKRDKRASFQEIAHVTIDALPALCFPLIILGGILTGIVTPTEAALVGAIVAFLVAFLYYKELHLTDIYKSIITTIKVSANVMLIVGFAGIFGWILTAEKFAEMFGEIIAGLTSNPFLILLFVNGLMLFMGCFINVTPNIILLSPVLFPLVQRFGIDPIHFGVIMCVNLNIGQVTPPVGIVSFAVVDAANVKYELYLRELWPYLFILFLALLIITYMPITSLWLPGVLFG